MKKLFQFTAILFVLIYTESHAQELTAKEQAYKDSIAALNQENELTAAARELYNAGNALFEQKKYADAIKKYNESIQKDPNFKDSYFNKGITEIEAAKYNDAVLSFTAYLALEKSGKGYFQRALANEKANKKSAAENDFKEAMKLDTKNEMIPYNYGVMLFNSADYENAVKIFTQAITLKPDFAFAYNDRGSSYRMQGKYAEAIADYEEAARKNPKLALALNNIGTVKRIQKDYVGAIAAFNRALSVDAGFYLAYNNRGAVYMDQNKPEQALVDFNKAIELNKNYAPAYNNRGGVYLKKEDWKAAEKDFSKAIELDKNYANAYVNRGAAKEMLRDAEGACDDWAKARELGSDIGKAYQSANCN